MKGIKKYLIISIIAIAAACSDRLQIEPEGILTEDQVYSSAQTSEMMLGSAYYSYMEEAVGDRYTYGDITTSNLDYKEGFSSVFNEPEIGTAEYFWTGRYETINIANNIILKIEEFAEYEEELAQQYIAEAKFIRALCYFDLLKFYGEGALTDQMDGLGVPLQLVNYDGSGIYDYLSRSTNAAVYEKIVKDLNEAIPALPEVYETEVKTASRATASSASALLSRVCLYMRDYESCIEAANQVAAPLTSGSNVFDLESDLRVLYPTDPSTKVKGFCSEDLFNLPITANLSVSYSTSTNRGKNNIVFASANIWAGQTLADAFVNPLDLRKVQLLIQGWDSNDQPKDAFDEDGNQLEELNNLGEWEKVTLYTYKFASAGEDNVPMIRVAEVYLNKAEALVHRDGLSQEAVDMLNAVHLRANPTDVGYQLTDFASPDELLNRILLERRLELMFENHERYDLIRTGRADQLKNPDLTEDQLVLPIPQIEVDLSSGIIEQNKAYK